MTVAENIGYGLRVRKVPKAKIRERVKELLKLIRLEGLERATQVSFRVATAARRPSSGLGGAARSPVAREPFGALDAKVRQELRRWLRKLHEEIHVTSIFVTHDQEEAFEVADRVVVMNLGVSSKWALRMKSTTNLLLTFSL